MYEMFMFTTANKEDYTFYTKSTVSWDLKREKFICYKGVLLFNELSFGPNNLTISRYNKSIFN